MNNTTRDRTTEGLDPDNSGRKIVPPTETPVVANSAHVPGGATEVSELEHALKPPMSGARPCDKAP